MKPAALKKELQFKAIRSSGPGGQHANKVSSKVALSFAVNTSEGLTPLEKTMVLQKLASFINKDGVLQLSAETHRSQHRNKELVTQRFMDLIKSALKKQKPRKATKPSKAAIEKRLNNKKRQAEKKAKPSK